MHGLYRLSPRAFITGLIFFASAAYFIVKCTVPEDLQEFRAGEQVLSQMMGERTLETGGFFEAYPDGKPSDFVEYLSTEQGAAMWPMTRGEFRTMDPQIEGYTPTKGRLLRPDHVEFRPYEVDPSGGRQLVYIPNDADSSFELQAYESPRDPPLFIMRLPFPSERPGIELR